MEEIATAVVSTENPAADEQRLDEDSNAETCPDYFVRSRSLLRKSPLVQAVPVIGLTRAGCVLYVASTTIGSLTDPTSSDVMLMIVNVTFLLLNIAMALIIRELQHILRPEGELDTLGIGTTKIRASALSSLENQRRFLRTLECMLILAGAWCVMQGVSNMVEAAIEQSPIHNFALAIGPIGLFMLLEGTLFVEFVFVLQVAAALASDAVFEVVHAIRNTSPEDTVQWDTNVVKPALALADGAVGLLSVGFSRGLALSYAGLWAMAVGAFAEMLYFKDGWEMGMLLCALLMLILLVMPMIMSRAVAAVSSSCDDLLTSINRRRVQSLEHGPRLYQLELALNQLNQGGGLGFVITKGFVRTPT